VDDAAEVAGVDDDETAGQLGRDRRRPRALIEQGELTEERPGRDRSDRTPADGRSGQTFSDDEELVAWRSLLGEHRSRIHAPFLSHGGQLGQLLLVARREHRDLLQQLLPLLAPVSHAISSRTPDRAAAWHGPLPG